MRFPAYPKYKSSGAKWLPEIPSHWGIVALRWLSRRYAGGTPDKNNDEYWEEGIIPWLNSGAVNDKYVTKPSAFISREGFLNSSAKWIPKGALVMALAGQGKTKGMVAQLGIDTTCNQSMAAIIPTKQLQSRYLYWWLTANYQYIRNLAGGEARDGLNLELIGGIPSPVPNEIEQRAIANFLDRETTRLDTLVAKKRELIEKLKEKRMALISQTVTRGLPPDPARAAGLNPHPKLKPSGIEWLGDVPEHWEVMRLKHVASIRGRIGFRGYTTDDLVTESEGALALGATHLDSTGHLNLCSPVYISWAKYFESPEIMVQTGDLLITQRGSTCGKVGVVDVDLGPATINPSLLLLRPSGFVHGMFLLYSMLGQFVQSVLATTLSSTAIPMLSQEQIGEISFPVPQLLEQRSIADFLDREATKLDRMIEKVEAAIEKLQEYRTALITAAVTGKIDVRGADV